MAGTSVGGLPVTLEELRAVEKPWLQASTLPGRLFSDAAVYDQEVDRLFRRSWVCLGREDEFEGPGSFRTYEIGGSGIVVLRTSAGELRGYHNVCRHRGTRLLEEPAGSGLKRILCPYHAWSYDLDGRVVGTPHMGEAEQFDRAEFHLYSIAVDAWRGFVFANLDPKPTPLLESLGGLPDQLRHFPLERLRRTHRVEYDIHANWKLIIQNANECYHCPGVHPQLVKITPYRSGEENLRDGPVFGGWMEIVDGATTLTPDGTTKRRVFPELTETERRRVFYYVLYPLSFLSLMPDYVTVDRFEPRGPNETHLTFDVYVDRDETGRADDAMGFWETTNRQDWHICELAHLGSKTAAYRSGRYSSEEEVVHLVDQYYVRRMGWTARPAKPVRRARQSRRASSSVT